MSSHVKLLCHHGATLTLGAFEPGLAVVQIGSLFGLFKVIALIVGAVLLLSSLIWVHADAQARGKRGWLVAALVLLLAWPVSLFGWYLLRPELPRGHAGRRRR
jgi:hypothetical protein